MVPVTGKRSFYHNSGSQVDTKVTKVTMKLWGKHLSMLPSAFPVASWQAGSWEHRGVTP